MAIRIMSNVWDNGPEDRTEMLVLLCLADHSNNEGYCYPSLKTIAKRCRLSRQGTINVIDRLIDKGWVRKESGGGRGNPNRYFLQLDRFDKGSSSLDGLDSEKGQVDKIKGQAHTLKGQVDEVKGSSSLDGNHQGTIKNRQGEATRTRADTREGEESPPNDADGNDGNSTTPPPVDASSSDTLNDGPNFRGIGDPREKKKPDEEIDPDDSRLKVLNKIIEWEMTKGEVISEIGVDAKGVWASKLYEMFHRINAVAASEIDAQIEDPVAWAKAIKKGLIREWNGTTVEARIDTYERICQTGGAGKRGRVRRSPEVATRAAPQNPRPSRKTLMKKKEMYERQGDEIREFHRRRREMKRQRK